MPYLLTCLTYRLLSLLRQLMSPPLPSSQVPLAALEALDMPSNRSLPAAKYLREVERRVAKDGSASIFRRDQDTLAVGSFLFFYLDPIFMFCRGRLASSFTQIAISL